MNERIKELTPKPWVFPYPDREMYSKEQFEKFAELSVRECVRYFNEDYQRDFDTLWREDLTRGIKKHFGVE